MLYHVVARAGSGSSGASNNDPAYVGSFTDAAIAQFTTTVKAEHIVEIRVAVNSLRAMAGSGAVYSGTDLDPNALRGQSIDDTHWTTLLANLDTARGLHDLPPISPQQPPAAAGELVRKIHIDDLRAGVR